MLVVSTFVALCVTHLAPIDNSTADCGHGVTCFPCHPNLPTPAALGMCDSYVLQGPERGLGLKTHTYIHAYMHTYRHTYIHQTHTHTYTHTPTYTYDTHAPMHTPIYTPIHTYTHTYAHTHTHAHTHTQLHTHNNPLAVSRSELLCDKSFVLSQQKPQTGARRQCSHGHFSRKGG